MHDEAWEYRCWGFQLELCLVAGISDVSVTSDTVRCLAPLLWSLCFYCICLQKWHQVEKGGLVKHSRLSLCIDSKDYKTRGLTVERCYSSSPSQHWSFAVKKLWWSVNLRTCTQFHINWPITSQPCIYCGIQWSFSVTEMRCHSVLILETITDVICVLNIPCVVGH